MQRSVDYLKWIASEHLKQGTAPMTNAFFFVHHGQTDRNNQGLLIRQQDSSLNKIDHSEAKAACRVLAGHSFSTLCHSTTLHATETAHIIASHCPCSLYPVDQLKEHRSFELENVPHKPTETGENFQERVIMGLKEAFSLPEHVLLVSSWEVYQVICMHFGQESVPFSNAHVAHFFQELGRWKLEILTD